MPKPCAGQAPLPPQAAVPPEAPQASEIAPFPDPPALSRDADTDIAAKADVPAPSPAPVMVQGITLPQGRVRRVLLYPHPMLRECAAPVGALDFAALTQLAADLLATMYHAQGRGLAAPQIGAPWRIFVMDANWKEGRPAPQIILDPDVQPITENCVALSEGCLSIPDHPVTVLRPEAVSLRAFDLNGRQSYRALSGIEARIVQHENDHLDGRLIVDFLGGGDAGIAPETEFQKAPGGQAIPLRQSGSLTKPGLMTKSEPSTKRAPHTQDNPSAQPLPHVQPGGPAQLGPLTQSGHATQLDHATQSGPTPDTTPDRHGDPRAHSAPYRDSAPFPKADGRPKSDRDAQSDHVPQPNPQPKADA